MPQDDATQHRGGDSELLVRLRNGNGEAFDTLVRSYGAALMKHAAWIVGSVDVAQDVVQEVFLTLWQERSRIEPTWDIASYLYGMTRRRAIDVVRSRQTTSRREQRWGEQQRVERETSYSGQTPASGADEIRAEVWAALAGVSPKCREVFMLIWDRQLSYREIAEESGLTEQTARIYASRALKRLVNVLGPRYRSSNLP